MNCDKLDRGGGVRIAGGEVVTVRHNGEAAIHGSVAKSGRNFTRVFDKRAVRLKADHDLRFAAEAPK